MRLKSPRIVLPLVLFLASVRTGLSAQTTISGGLTGVVTDQTNAAVPNAEVKIKDNRKGTIQSTTTDREGVYRFFFLAPSAYMLTVTHQGFRKESRTVDVLLGPAGTANIVLSIAQASSEITVTDEAPLIQAENGDVSTTMKQKQISEVPNPGNDLTYIVQTAPGVVMNTDMQGGANFSILGMPGTSYRYTIDGLSVTDDSYNVQLAGALALVLGENQVQEAAVVTTGYSGQFGGAAGGNVNYFTKSGSNEFHGNVQYYWNGRVLNADDWFNKALNKPRPFSIANQWAGSSGGPIRKNKLFAFFDTEGLQLLIPQNFFVTIPSPEFEAATIANIDSRFGPSSASDAFYKKIFNLYNATPGASSASRGGFDPADPTGCTGFVGSAGPNGQLGTTLPCALHFFKTRGRPGYDVLTSGRVDWNATAKDRAFLRLQHEGGRNPISTDPISPVFDADGTLQWWEAQTSETHTFGPAAASQFLVAATYIPFFHRMNNPSQTLAAFPTVLSFVQGTFANLGRGDFVNPYGSGGSLARYQLAEDLVKTRSNHKFGVGLSFENSYWTFLQYNANRIGTLMPVTLDAFYQGGVDPMFLAGTDPNPDYTQLSQSFPSANSQGMSFYTLAIYAQDEWHARKNLSLTFALRAEHQSNLKCRDRCFVRFAGPFNSLSHGPNQPYKQGLLVRLKQAWPDIAAVLWSPRFSFAWQPFGVSHNPVLRGGIGMIYDSLPAAPGVNFSSNPPLLNSYTVLRDNLAPNETTSLFKDAAASNAAFVDGFGQGKTLAQIHLADPSFFPPTITSPEGQMHSPEFQRWSLELQQVFGTETSVSIGYFGHHGIHEMMQNPNVNAFGFGSLPAGLCSSPPVPPCADSRFSEVNELASRAISNYNGIVASLRHRFSRSTQGLFQLNYTYGHAFDEVSNGGLFGFAQGSSIFPQDPKNLRGAYGPAEYDVRHSLNANYVWEVPVKTALRGHAPDFLLKGWQISGTVFARTGFPYTVFDFAESVQLQSNNYFGTIYAVPGEPLRSTASCGEGAAATNPIHPCLPAQFSQANGTVPNPNALFLQSGCETGFNAGNLPGSSGPCSGSAVSFPQGRNRFRGPGYFNTDFAIMKNTKIHAWENATLGIGFQFFNLLNHPNFGFPDNFSSDPTFGQIFYLEQSPTGILGNSLGGDVTPRMIQLKAQLRF
jgi:Carboxypeptidase regulatory-like domain